MTHSDFPPASKPVLWEVRGCEEWLARGHDFDHARFEFVTCGVLAHAPAPSP